MKCKPVTVLPANETWTFEIKFDGGPVAMSNARKEAPCAIATPHSVEPLASATCSMLQDILADEDQEALRWCRKRAKLSRLEPFRDLAKSSQKTLERRCRL
jgi:hypothetical protein